MMDRMPPPKTGKNEQERRARLDKALRENLKKRKQQQRARNQPQAPSQTSDQKSEA